MSIVVNAEPQATPSNARAISRRAKSAYSSRERKLTYTTRVIIPNRRGMEMPAAIIAELRGKLPIRPIFRLFSIPSLAKLESGWNRSIDQQLRSAQPTLSEKADVHQTFDQIPVRPARS